MNGAFRFSGPSRLLTKGLILEPRVREETLGTRRRLGAELSALDFLCS